MADQQTNSGGSKKHGRDKIKCARYRGLKIREKNKLKNVLRSSMLAEATRYAAKHNLLGYLNSISVLQVS